MDGNRGGLELRSASGSSLILYLNVQVLDLRFRAVKESAAKAIADVNTRSIAGDPVENHPQVDGEIRLEPGHSLVSYLRGWEMVRESTLCVDASPLISSCIVMTSIFL